MVNMEVRTAEQVIEACVRTESVRKCACLPPPLRLVYGGRVTVTVASKVLPSSSMRVAGVTRAFARIKS